MNLDPVTLYLLQQLTDEVGVVIVDTQALGLRQSQTVPGAVVGIAMGQGCCGRRDEAPSLGSRKVVKVIDWKAGREKRRKRREKKKYRIQIRKSDIFLKK